jgi:hypothetical protein
MSFFLKFFYFNRKENELKIFAQSTTFGKGDIVKWRPCNAIYSCIKLITVEVMGALYAQTSLTPFKFSVDRKSIASLTLPESIT